MNTKLLAITDKKRFIDEFWLSLGDTSKIKTPNIIGSSELFKENPNLAIVNIMRKPENFAYTCEVLLNNRVAQYQALILKTMWSHSFPMLIGTRGGSKSYILALYALLRALFIPGSKIIITGAAFRQAKIIFNYIETIWKNAPMLQDILSSDKNNRPMHGTDEYYFKINDSTITAIPTGTGESIRGKRSSCLHPDTLIETEVGLMRIDEYQKYMDNNPAVFTGNIDNSLEKPSHFIITKPMDCYQVKTEYGFDFICSEIHEVMTSKGWKLGKDLSQDDYLIFENKYKFPDKNLVIEGIEVDEDIAWLLGILLSEGSVSSKGRFSISMTDENCINRIFDVWKKISDKYNLNLNICRYIKEEYKDYRGWECKKCFVVGVNNWRLRDLFVKLGLDRARALTKRIPFSILQSPKKVVLSFLSAFMEGDGTCFHWKDKMSDKNLGIAVYTASKQLADELHILFHKLDIFSSKGSRESKISKNPQYQIRFYGPNAVKIFDLVEVPKWEKFKNNYYLGNEKLKRKPKNQLKIKSVIKLNKQLSLRDFTIPISHSFIGNSFIQHNCLISDEFNSINVQVFEEIMQGFGAVSLNPIEAMIDYSKLKAMQELGAITENQFNEEQSKVVSNQTIISGTCGYTFEHLYKYWKNYRDIITNNEKNERLKKMFGEEVSGISPKDFCIIRIPYDLIPKGIMNEKTIAKAKATSNSSIFNSEFGAVFLSDSQGFFKRSLIENCVSGRNPNVPIIKKTGEVDFNIVMEGIANVKYVMGVDPAAEKDNFAIIILELWDDHRRIVYSWTTNNENHKLKLKYGLVDEHDYYRYCGRKIRDLMRKFNIEAIAMDAQGGGKSVAEVLGDPQYLKDKEYPIYPVANPKKSASTDHLAGLHLLHLIEFSDSEWVYTANHGLRQDMETRELCFPACDSISFAELHEIDKLLYKNKAGANAEIDSLRESAEDVLLEIEELKNELVLIEHTKTPAGRDKWDTPQIKGLGTKKGRLRKDRYSALLLANSIGRGMIGRTVAYQYNPWGGFAQNIVKNKSKMTPEENASIDDGFSFGACVVRRR